ncbi:MAG: YbjQ family protein [Acidimicrobiia bacterium]|nr:YbjQ family protein [Acidimicrobiia bacterium]
MEDVLPYLLFLLLFAAPFALGVIGKVRENAHLEDIKRRDEMHRGFPVVDIQVLPAGMEPRGSEIVLGQVVIASDYLKNFFASYRAIFGGEVKSFSRMVERGKAEARLRMIEEARGKGAAAVINVRFETSQIGAASGRAGQAMSEVLCYGTAIYT